MAEYPTAELRQYFAIHYLRWLADSELTVEAGPDAHSLLTAVVVAQDRIRYLRPVSFYNEQICRRSGIGSVPALIRARNRAIELGLLQYKPGAKRRPGSYFVSGFPNDLLQKPFGNRTESEKKTTPSNPIPKPSPKPQRGAGSAAVDSKTKTKFDPKAIELPGPLDTPAFRVAWSDFTDHRRGINKPLTELAATRLLKKAAAWGPAGAIASIDDAIESGWAGLFPPKAESVALPPQRPKPTTPLTKA